MHRQYIVFVCAKDIFSNTFCFYRVSKGESWHAGAVGCNGGMDICYLQSKYPQACISGATENWAEAAIAGKYLDVSYCPDTEKDIFVLLTGKYDYILLADKDKQYEDFEVYVNKLMQYLSETGSIHISE